MVGLSSPNYLILAKVKNMAPHGKKHCRRNSGEYKKHQRRNSGECQKVCPPQGWYYPTPSPSPVPPIPPTVITPLYQSTTPAGGLVAPITVAVGGLIPLQNTQFSQGGVTSAVGATAITVSTPGFYQVSASFISGAAAPKFNILVNGISVVTQDLYYLQAIVQTTTPNSTISFQVAAPAGGITFAAGTDMTFTVVQA